MLISRNTTAFEHALNRSAPPRRLLLGAMRFRILSVRRLYFAYSSARGLPLTCILDLGAADYRACLLLNIIRLFGSWPTMGSARLSLIICYSCTK